MNADPTTAQATRRLRKWATISALLMVPATILAGLLAVTGEGGRCLTYGGCGSNPDWLYQGSLVVAGIAWVTVLRVPRKTVGGNAYVLQLAAQGTFLMAVVTTYA
ncbi:hypothetical protein ACIQRJ_06300 [Streptomyces niveus]|uniref:hypothetical protein n=1 Tax=Streptomyces niveus TaxID=193462 RepID=UPI003833A4B0